MSKKLTKARHGDSVLSQEEFEKAIDEYKKRKAQREKLDADDVEEEVEETEEKKPDDIEAQLAEVKERRDRRDEAGDPEDEEEAMSVIAHQDEDIDILFDIIDTLLAKQDFDAADEEEPVEDDENLDEDEEFLEEEEVENKDGFDKLNKMKGKGSPSQCDADDEEGLPEDDEELQEDEEDVEDEELQEDEDDIEDDEELQEDEDDIVDEEEVKEDEDDLEDDEDKKAHMDSAASRALRNHMLMGAIGRQVGINGLEYKDIKSAKKAVIKAVRPELRLDGKSDAYINGAFNSARAAIKARKKKGTAYQKRQMFNKDSRDTVSKNSAMGARQRMIARLNKK